MCILALYKFVRGRILIHFWLHVWNEPTSTRSFLMSNTRFFQTFWIIGLFSNFLFDTNLMSPYQLNHYIFTTSSTSKQTPKKQRLECSDFLTLSWLIMVFSQIISLTLSNEFNFVRVGKGELCHMKSTIQKLNLTRDNNYENFFLSSVTLLLQTPIWAAN